MIKFLAAILLIIVFPFPAQAYVEWGHHINEAAARNTRICFGSAMNGDKYPGIRNTAMSAFSDWADAIEKINDPVQVSRNCKNLILGIDVDITVNFNVHDGNSTCKSGLASTAVGGPVNGVADYMVIKLDKDCDDLIHWRKTRPPSNKFDWLTVVRHEHGHVLGLDHETDIVRGLMYPVLELGKRKRINADAIKGVIKVYNWI